MAKSYKATAVEYARSIVEGRKLACRELRQACQRFLDDLERDDLELRTKDPDFVIGIIEKLCVHRQGEDMNGDPLMNKPLILQPWQVFIVYNLVGWYIKGTNERRTKEALIYVSRKNGKAISLNSDIPTPNGWRKMRDIQIGDYVFGQDGKPSVVMAVSEIFNKPMYAVRFEDGAVIRASADHLWTVQTKESRRASRRPLPKRKNFGRPELRKTGGWFEATTEEMFEKFLRPRPDGKGVDYYYRVPMAKAVEYEEKELAVNPYTLGVWLGDGSTGNNAITCSDQDKDEMIMHLASDGNECRWRKYKNRAGAIILGKKIGRINPIRDALREIGVFNNKHIPDIYLQGSIEQRLALLQGLMDTDGTCSKAGQCEFSQKSEALSMQVVELLSSLGIKATMKAKTARCNGKDCGLVYRVQFWTDKTLPCFRLERKKTRLKEHLAPRMNAKSIVGIERIEDEPSKCIAIDNPSHLYLVGRQYTATHNTNVVAALAFGLALLDRKSGSKIYIAAASLKQAAESFDAITYTMNYRGMYDDFHVIDNSVRHAIDKVFENGEGQPEGSVYIEALAANPKKHDSLNSNIQIIDELHAVSMAQYNRFKESGKAYQNKLCIGISTAGDDVNTFCYRRVEYACKMLDGQVKDDTFFAFIARAEADENGEVDFLSAEEHEKANPSYGVIIRPEDMMADALRAKHDPQMRKDFLSRSLNVYTTSMKAYFDLDEFRRSDGQYTWTLEELAKLPIDWYGGADLSKIKDLTAACLYGEYEGVDIIITHAFFPVTRITEKAEEDDIPLYEWKEEGWLTLCNSPTINIADVVNWFIKMREMGFKIKQVGHDRKFAGEEYIPMMRKAHFAIFDQSQTYWLKSQGFKHIEKAASDGRLYYCHSTAYEYCLANVKAWEGVDDAIAYEKVDDHHRIDLFDASVFACIRMIKNAEKRKKAAAWFGE